MSVMNEGRHPLYLTYLGVVEALGFAVIAFSIFSILMDGVGNQWLVLAALTVLTAAIALEIPGVNSRFSVGDTFVFLNAILFGPAAGALTAALDGLIGSIRISPASRRTRAIPFNTAIMALSAFLAGETFFEILGRGPLTLGPMVPFQKLLLPSAGLALVHYLCNSGGVAVVLALEGRGNVFRIWRESLLGMSAVYLTNASAATLIAFNSRSVTAIGLAVLATVILVTYSSCRAFWGRAAS